MTKIRSISLRAAAQLAALRKEQGLTLKKLSSITGLSEAYLSRLENFKTSISLDNLVVLADALNVPIEMFFNANPIGLPMVIARAGEGARARFRGKKGVTATLPSEKKARKIMEPLIFEIDESNKDIPKQSHSGEEFNYILEGRCEFLYGNQRYILEKDDCVYFNCDVPHSLRPISKISCKILAVVGSGEYALHGNLKKLLNDF